MSSREFLSLQETMLLQNDIQHAPAVQQHFQQTLEDRGVEHSAMFVAFAVAGCSKNILQQIRSKQRTITCNRLDFSRLVLSGTAIVLFPSCSSSFFTLLLWNDDSKCRSRRSIAINKLRWLVYYGPAQVCAYTIAAS